MLSGRARVLLLGAAAVVLVVHSLVYNFVTDDAFISFVYSRNLAEHGRLAFDTRGTPVEGYTNFSWTVLLGVLMFVGIPPEISSRVLGTACALGCVYFVFRAMERALERPTAWAAVPAMLLACSSGFACWTSGGLETQLFTLLIAIAIDAVVAAESDPKAMYRAGAALAFAAWTRPEGPLIAAAIGAVRIASNGLAKRWITKSDLIAAAIFVAIWAPWFAWRWHYYGWPFPNTYYVKASGPWTSPNLAGEMRANGLYYVWAWAKQTHVLYALPLVALGFVVKPRTPRFVLAAACGAIAIVYLPYAVSVGGDFMGLHRFIMPVFVCTAVLVALGLEWVGTRLKHRMLCIALPAVVVAAFAATQLVLTIDSTRSCANQPCPNDHGIDSPAYLMIYTADRAAIGKAMASCFRDDDFSIFGGAGAQPYYARMRGIDVFGLVSDRIAHEEPRRRARAGHTKFARDQLLAEYDPDFVFSCYAIHPSPTPPALPCDVGFWKSRGFEQVTLHVPELQQAGTYYTFLVKKDRHLECPGIVH
jgi:arabinofuranosyltransferase